MKTVKNRKFTESVKDEAYHLLLCDFVYLNNLQYWQFKSKYQDTYNYYCFALMTERFPVTAWKPVLIVWTEHLEWHVIHCKKNSRVSLFRMVSGERQVWQVTYSLIYLLNTFSICFCWKRPFIINWLLPSTAPTVPNSAERNARRCFGWRCNLKKYCNHECYESIEKHDNELYIFRYCTSKGNCHNMRMTIYTKKLSLSLILLKLDIIIYYQSF